MTKLTQKCFWWKKHSAIIDRRNESYIQWIWWTGIKYCHRLKRQKQQNARIFLSKMCNWMCNNNKNVEVWSKHGVKIAWIFVKKKLRQKKNWTFSCCVSKNKNQTNDGVILSKFLLCFLKWRNFKFIVISIQCIGIYLFIFF